MIPTPLRDLTPDHIATLLRLAEAVERDWVEMAEKTGKDWSPLTDTLIDRPANRALATYIKALPRPAMVELVGGLHTPPWNHSRF